MKASRVIFFCKTGYWHHPISTLGLWGYRGATSHSWGPFWPQVPLDPQQPWQPLQTALQGFLFLQPGSCSTRSKFISEGRALSQGLAPRASFSMESKLNTARDCRGMGFEPQGLCQCSQGTWQQQHQVFQDFSPPTGFPATHGGLFSTAGVTAALQDTQQPQSACSSWILIPKSPKKHSPCHLPSLLHGEPQVLTVKPRLESTFTFPEKNFFLISSLNISWGNLRLCPIACSLGAEPDP